MTVFEHDGVRFNYECHGDGPVVVFCHGLTGDLNQPMKLLSPLDGFRLIVWDARAHGRTEPIGPDTKLNFATFASDLKALLDHLQIDRAIVGGISMGAGVAVRFAVEWPDRVVRLILVRPAWFDQPWPDNLMLLRTVAELLDRHDVSTARRRFVRTEAYAQLRRDQPSAAEAALGYFDRPGAVRHNARLWQLPASVPIDSPRELSGITMPALIIGCERDPAHPYVLVQRWHAALPNATLDVSPSAIEDRAAYERSARHAVLQFLRSG